MFRVFYGILECSLDVSNICLTKLTHDGVIYIPAGDHTRSLYFGDPSPGNEKSIFVLDTHNNQLYQYEAHFIIQLHLNEHIIVLIDERVNNNSRNNSLTNGVYQNVSSQTTDNEENRIHRTIFDIHSKLTIKYGSLNEEFPEQRMAVRFLTGREKVLEIGGNIGRNSLIIASILQNNIVRNNFVSLECDPAIAKQLAENRDSNGFYFPIESVALSKRKLIQKGWDTIPSDILLPNYQWVNIMSFDEIQQKHNIVFDTFVLDCEGAFYYILMDMPEILNNIHLILMENDYGELNNKKYVDSVLTRYGFTRVYHEAGGWGPCQPNFFEAWKKQ